MLSYDLKSLTYRCTIAAILALPPLVGGAWLAIGTSSDARSQSAGDDNAASSPTIARRMREKAAQAKKAASPAAIAAAPDIAAKLKQNGAGTCGAQVDAAAGASMTNVIRSNTISNWAKTSSDKRLVQVAIGQKYPEGSPVPYGATSIVAAPTPDGHCDAIAVQVVPSPLTCDKLREAMTLNNQIVGDLAGVLALQDSSGAQTLLVPTAANTCVIVGVRTAFVEPPAATAPAAKP